MTQNSVGFQSDKPTRPGMPLGKGHDRGYIAGGEAPKIVEITVDQERNTHLYDFAVGGLDEQLQPTSGEVIEVTSGGAATKTSIRNLFITAVLALALTARRVDAYDSDTDKLRLEGRTPGDDFPFGTSDDDLSAEVIQEATANESIPFGVGVCAAAQDGAVELPRLTIVAAVAKVMTATPTFSAGDEWIVNILLGGKTYSAPVTMVTDLATTLTAMAEALNDQLPADSVNVSSDGSALTFTSEVAGQDFDITSGVSDADDAGNTTPVAIATTTANTAAGYSLTRGFRGVALCAPREAVLPAQDESIHLGGQSLPVRYEGPVLAACEPGITPVPGDKVHLRAVKSGTKLRGHWTNVAVPGETVEFEGVRWTDHVSPKDYGSTRVASIFVGSQAWPAS